MTALADVTVAVLVDGDALWPGSHRLRAGHSEGHLVRALRRLVGRVVVEPFESIARLTSWVYAVQPDLVFNMTEHADGDRHKDVHVCAALDLHGIPYTGPGPKGLMLCRDKAISKLVAARHGFVSPPFFEVDARSPRLPRDLALPLVVKPRDGDSSEGISQSSLVRTREALERRIALLGRAGSPAVICEAFVGGREMVVGVVGRRVMPPRELIIGGNGGGPPPRLWSSRMKHDAAYRRRWHGRLDFADLTPHQLRTLRDAVLTTFEALAMRDFGRFDVKLTPAGEWAFLEANPNPALVPHHRSFSGTWAALSYDEMIAAIVRGALARAESNVGVTPRRLAARSSPRFPGGGARGD
jgi:D-alanine-D-alanine ligase